MLTRVRSLLFAGLGILCQAPANAFADNKTLVAGFTHVPPLFIERRDGTAGGFAVDVLNEAADRTGIAITWKRLPNREVRKALENKLIDVYPAGVSTAENRASFHLTRSWWRTHFVVLTRLNHSVSVENPHSITHAMEVPDEVRKYLGQWTFHRAVSRPEAVASVCRSEVDGAFLDRMALEETLLRRTPDCHSVALDLVDGFSAPLQLSLMANGLFAAQADVLAESIENMASDGTLASLALRYPSVLAASGIYLSSLVQVQSKVAAWKTAAMVMALLLLLCTWLIVRLRQDVRRRLHTATELERAYYDLEQFAYASHHDLREPLRNMSLFSQILLRRGLDDPRASEHLGYIVGGAARMSALLDAVRSYMQVERKAPDDYLESQEALEDALAELNDSVEAARAEIRVGEMPSVWFNRDHLALLFRSLIENSLKFSAAEHTLVRVSGHIDNGHAVFSVADNGAGIPAEYQDRVFGVFKRLHNREVSGTGVGLAICRKIVEQRHGRIWIESGPGEGTSVRFTIPRTPPKTSRLAKLLRLQ